MLHQNGVLIGESTYIGFERQQYSASEDFEVIHNNILTYSELSYDYQAY